MKQYRIYLIIISVISFINGANYPDQYFKYKDMEMLFENAVEVSNLQFSNGEIELVADQKEGYIIFQPDSSEYPFNEGLPSWNGFAPREQNSAFKVQMRFPYGNGWSPWLTVGFWKRDIWSSYGSTSYSGGKINIDIAKLYAYQQKWQFKVIMERTHTSYETPRLNKLSFFVSDSRTTSSFNVLDAVADNPEEIFIDTEFYHQYSLDPVIGGSICSPTSVAMILRSYDIELDPVQFARDNKDPYWDIFGVWPRVVQNASEFGLDGAVTRYRDWSDAREVLGNGGRIAISVGQPLYTGHLMMLAGFDENGTPIIHDPARSNGYAYKFNKSDLSRSWFNKGGVSYTFFLKDSINTTGLDRAGKIKTPKKHKLVWNYPNPFNNSTSINFIVNNPNEVNMTIFNLQGKSVLEKDFGKLQSGQYSFLWNVSENVSSGVYVVKIDVGNSHFQSRLLYLK